MSLPARLRSGLRVAARRLKVRKAATRIADRLPTPARARLMDAITLARYQPLVPPEALQSSYERALEQLAAYGTDVESGDYLEFGVCHGTSLATMHRALATHDIQGVRTIGFDSFQGLPDSTVPDDRRWSPGEFQCSMRVTRRLLERWGVDLDSVVLVDGWYSETLGPETRDRLDIERALVIMVDCDMYQSATEALEFALPCISDRAIIFFDDWHEGGLAESGLGERRAFEEALQRHDDLRATSLPDLRYSPGSEVFLVERTVVPAPGTTRTGWRGSHASMTPGV